ncbi:hypothetical protein GCM10010912_54220 [Paenibacillus albidus]|uniref:SPOR domain-containing protein n=1 Tax=Paenibacillus albidus TaxID=2041023 RepID=A0A917FUQ2_9BACL|nr:SPOR domain-containing protein [Paenibacillus albidus]GGG02586.1 hypothetical protein GCM10010912_54220 [Paenibacillus albidus]
MNNGRMTFRFDVDKDKSPSEMEKRRADHGAAAAQDYEAADLWPQSGALEHKGNDGAGLQPVYREPLEAEFYGYDEEREDPGGRGWDQPDREAASPGISFFRSEVTPDLWRDSGRPRRPAGNDEEEGDNRLLPQEEPYLIQESYGSGLRSEEEYGGSYHSRRPSYWWKFALSVAGALGTGILLGYAALSFFEGGGAGSPAGTGVTDTAAVQNLNSGNAEGQAGTGTSGLPITGTEPAGVKPIPVQVASQSYYLLQYGVFSAPAGAEQARQELLAEGLAAGLDPADGNRVYAGISPDREAAKLLSNNLKSQGIELYVREVALPSVEQLAYNGQGEAVNHYFAVSGQLLGKLSGLSASWLSMGGPGTALDRSAVSDLHMQWKEAAKTLEQGVTPEAKEICAQLEKSMSQGISAMEEYSKNKVDALLWEVQSSMMSFLTGQKQLLSVLN